MDETAPLGGRHAVETPERVAVSWELAGLGHRSVAFLIDGVILLTAYAVVGLVVGDALVRWFEALSEVFRTVAVIGVFALTWGYALLFEWLWNGQTPGKRLAGLRVVRTDGAPYDLVTSAVRNLLRVIDGFPGNTYALGVVVTALTRRHERIGDLLAGTVLVKDGPVDLSVYDVEETDAAPADPEAEALAGSLTSEAFELLTEWAGRRAHLEATATGRVAVSTAARLAETLPLAEELKGRLGDAVAAEAFLDALLRAARQGGASGGRREGALAGFVAARREAWAELDARSEALDRGRLDLDGVTELDRRWRQATGDLAWVQTFHPRSVAARYLNALCARAYHRIYRQRPGSRRSLWHFFDTEFPEAVWSCRSELVASVLLFATGMLLGAGLTAGDPAVAELLLGRALMHTVEQGRVWTHDLLSVMPPGVASARILTNNISVTFSTFAGGLTLGIWTTFSLVLNGGLLGVALVATSQHGVEGQLLDFIAAHGPVELSVIMLAGAAGLRMGRALVAPGQLSRSDALRLRGREAVRIILGGVPLLVVVGVVEGYVSPGDLFPTWAKATLGFGLAAAMWTWLYRKGRGGSRKADAGSQAG